MAPTFISHDQMAGSYYEVLGVTLEAPEEEIRKRYHGIVRTLHPDRWRAGNGAGETLDRFYQVQSAWRCLSDPTRRLLYDLRNFGRSSLAREAGLDGAAHSTAEDKLASLQKDQALRDANNMQVVLEKVLRREHAVRGVIIKRAFYGDLRLREDCMAEGLSGARTIELQDLVGPVVDVALPLQCLVEQHTIVVPGGASASKADLPGFYNPAPLDPHVELSLYVLYEFRSCLHEVIVGDRESLSLPYRKHAVPVGKAPRGPFSSANIMMLRRGCEPQVQADAGACAEPDEKAQLEATGPASGISQRSSPLQALQRAVAAYSVQRLHTPQSPGEATPGEFAAVGLGLVGALLVVVKVTSLLRTEVL
mmetsp:Transcript_56369/g.131355  ORF Transcript_56369/g.131355 Transcript_56369/m.131355 type:complete len:364 (+) Transcript_56369:74-1165(+)|eukprot:CAMPEP_0171097550 /NCGR_PEP_ID=MMETSP0766_2-20121228/47612_1 /TAXON_ID=439317 /ORGANISM="Gambierdiscus australes, Strain CAWD 149" /LENGTH=363 /DNA_ID=CAMNT_0011556765 /DNA_START=71 /DNA_END=1162 /DNA_ORIENTATION=-